jgi:short-subunit dehydrogenase
LRVIAADLIARGAPSAEIVEADLSAFDGIEPLVSELRTSFGAVTEVLLAYGTLGEQSRAENDIAAARELLQTNFTSAALWVLTLLKAYAAATPFCMTVIGSVAGDRGRASNFIYGAAKGGLDIFLEGLTQKYVGTSVRIITVKPGFVDTPMTADIAKGGPLWSTPEKVAADIRRAVLKDQRVVYTPWFWRPIMFVIRHLPWFVFKRLKI